MAANNGSLGAKAPSQLVILSCGHQFLTGADDRPESTRITFSKEHPNGIEVTTPKTTYNCIRCVKVVNIVKFGDFIKVL